MKNWIKTIDETWINLNHFSELYIKQEWPGCSENTPHQICARAYNRAALNEVIILKVKDRQSAEEILNRMMTRYDNPR